MLSRSHEEAAPTRFSRLAPSGHLVWRTEFLGPPPSPMSSDSLKAAGAIDYVDPQPGEVRPPQAFLVEQEPGAVVNPHFHFVDQFQVVAAGYGKLGAHDVAPLTVHFAGANTGYGPITPGPEGLSYFTFRASADETGAQYLPGARPRLRPGPKRNVVAPRVTPAGEAEIAARRDTITEAPLDKEDGLAVFYLRIAPGTTVAAPQAGGGLSLLVTGGALQEGSRTLGHWSCLFVAPGESATLQASARGAEVLVLRYPRKSNA